MMDFALFIIFAIISKLVTTQQCPQIYRRLSQNHSFCMPTTCKVISGGKVSDSDKEIILKTHNELRSKLASGNETQYQTLPSAANMMQLEWDDELAAVAQAHANQCKFQHDTADQRAVGNFSVGQNLLEMTGSATVDWSFIKYWYTSEVKYFLPEYNKPFQFHGNYGHFSQVIWAKTWKVGCGAAVYKDDNNRNKILITCNYGPGGNLIDSEAYQVGPPCSACPKNTKCSDKYPGLCKSITPNGPQKTRPSSSDYLLYCDFSAEDSKGCRNVTMTGSRSFMNKTLYTGKYVTAVFNAGEKMNINFGSFQYKDGLCAYFIGRFGPNVAGQKADSSVVFGFSSPGLMFPSAMKDSRSDSSWHTIGILMRSNRLLQITYTFEVEKGAPPQYFEFKEYGVRGGKCP